jgi:hypothetical protein
VRERERVTIVVAAYVRSCSSYEHICYYDYCVACASKLVDLTQLGKRRIKTIQEHRSMCWREDQLWAKAYTLATTTTHMNTYNPNNHTESQ